MLFYVQVKSCITVDTRNFQTFVCFKGTGLRMEFLFKSNLGLFNVRLIHFPLSSPFKSERSLHLELTLN